MNLAILKTIGDYFGLGFVYAGYMYYFENPLNRDLAYLVGKGIVWPWSLYNGITDSSGWLLFIAFLVFSLVWNTINGKEKETNE